MKKILLLIGIVLAISGCSSQSQLTDAEKLQEKRENQRLYSEAEQALTNQDFVLEADQVLFKWGRTVFVSPNTNFVALEDGYATVQVTLNGPYAGPNGIGGITVEGNASNIKMNKTKKGDINFSMNVVGVGISAQVEIQVYRESNKANVTVSPNFNSNRVTLSGKLIPSEKSSVYKGRSL